MSWQQLQTEKNIEDEIGFKNFLRTLWRCDVEDLPATYGVDFVAIEFGRVSKWVEFKSRRQPFGQYPSLHISAKKFAAGKNLEQQTMKPFFIFAGYSCGAIAMIDAGEIANPEIIFAGRTVQRRHNVETDIEPMIVIPNGFLKLVRESGR